jgi:voltage-gated potassium channel
VELRDRINGFVARHEVAWELAFAALAIVFVALGLVNPANPDQELAVYLVEWAITLVFAAEFTVRIWAAPVRRAYLRSHLIDLVSLIPPARWMRPLRLVRLLRLVRSFAGLYRAVGHMERMASHRGLIWMVAAWLAVTVLASLAYYLAEHGVNDAVASPADAVWWGVVTLTTVGYGDIYPVTAEGRLAASALMLLGIGLYSAITASVTSYFIVAERSAPTPLSDVEHAHELLLAGALTSDEFVIIKARALASGSTPEDHGSPTD